MLTYALVPMYPAEPTSIRYLPGARSAKTASVPLVVCKKTRPVSWLVTRTRDCCFKGCLLESMMLTWMATPRRVSSGRPDGELLVGVAMPCRGVNVGGAP